MFEDFEKYDYIIKMIFFVQFNFLVRQPAASRSCMLRLLLFAALTFAATLSFIPITNANQLATSDSLNSPVIDLNMEDVMRSLRRMKRATKRWFYLIMLKQKFV